MTRRPLLELAGVSRVFGDRETTAAVKDVSLAVAVGEFVAIVGRSGSGKSTLLNILGLLDRPTSGRYWVDGNNIAEVSEKRRDELRGRSFGFVFQDSNGLEHRSVAKNIELTLVTQKYPTALREALIEDALRTVGLEHRANHRVADLSGGERQRMAIARAIVHNPAVLLVDEPTGSLDTANADEIHRLLTKLNEAGTTVIAVTHDERLAAIATRRVTVQDGAILADSGPGDTAADTHVSIRPRVSRRAAFADRLSDTLTAVAERGAKSLLNILVIALGVAGIVAGLGINTSASAQVTQIFNDAALDEVRIATRPAAPAMTGDAVNAATELDGVLEAGLLYSVSADAVSITRLPTQTPSVSQFGGPLLGVSAGTLSVFGIDEPERFSAALTDPFLARSSVLLGAKAATELGVASTEPGVRIWINGNAFSVVGIISPDERHANVASAVLVSAQAVASAIAPDDAPILVAKTDPGRARAIADALPLQLNPTSPQSYIAQSTADLAELRATVDGSLAGVFAAVAAVLLLVAVLSTSSSLSASVLYRRKEIGLRRALGASRAAITSSYTREGFLLGILGGLAGAALGVCGLMVLSIVQQWPAYVDPLVVGGSVLLGAMTGTVASFVPALRASALDPAVALRS